jgi:hypothetical protein
LIGALGFFRALQHLGTNPVLTWLTSSVLALYGAGALMAGFFPLPDSRHNGFYLFYAIFFGPGLFAITLWNRRDSRLLKGYLITTNILMIATYVVIMGIGGFVTRTNVGLFLRINALAALPWITVAACSLKQSAASRTSLS